MPIKRLAFVLVVVLGCVVFMQTTPVAHGNFADRVTTTVGTSITTLQRAIFKFITSHKQPKPRDMVRLQIEGLDLSSGDELAVSLTGDNLVELGDPSTNDVLVMDVRNRALGQLGSFPNDFTNCKAKYNPRRKRLNLFCKEGTALRIPVDLATGGGAFKFQTPVTVVVYVNGTPFTYPATFEMRLKNRPAGPLTESGKYRNP